MKEVYGEKSPRARFSKVPKLFGSITSDIILFVGTTLRSYFNFYPLYNIRKEKTSFLE